MPRPRRRTSQRRVRLRTGRAHIASIADQPRPGSLGLDPELVAQAFAEADTERKQVYLPATGLCHDCGRQIGGERRFCGPCLTKH